MNYIKSFNLFGNKAMQIPCIELEGEPTASTEGAVGMLGIDINSEEKKIYKCIEAADNKYVWKSVLTEAEAGLSKLQAQMTEKADLTDINKKISAIDYTELKGQNVSEVINPEQFNFTLGSISTSTGLNMSADNRIRSEWMKATDVQIAVPSDIYVTVYYYDNAQKYLSAEVKLTDGIYTIGAGESQDIEFYKLVMYYTDDIEITDISEIANAVKIIKAYNTPLSVGYESGEIYIENGRLYNTANRIRSMYIPAESLVVKATDEIKYTLRYYDNDKEYISGGAGWLTGNNVIKKDDFPENTSYIRIMIREVNDIDLTSVIGTYSSKIELLKYTELTAAVIENKKAVNGHELAIAEQASVVSENISDIKKNTENISVLTSAVAGNSEKLASFSEAVAELPHNLFTNDVKDIEYVIGTISSDNNGKNVALNTRIRSKSYINTLDTLITTASDIKTALYFYNEGNYISASGFLTDNTVYVSKYMPANCTKFRFIVAYNDDREITDVNELSEKITVKSLISRAHYDVYEHDIPENIGVLNAILNFKQLTNIKYTPLATLPHISGDMSANTEYTGMLYSSSRIDMGYVPTCISLYTFMTALQNPNSYLYTVDLGELGNENGDTYYGTVCSTAVCYALNLLPTYTTYQWTEIPGMELIEHQSPYGLKLGDTIVGNGHVVMVTDITRNKRGKIGKITISESKHPVCISTDYTPEELKKAYPPEAYKYCRYKYIYAVTHDQSPYVAVEDEEEQEIIHNTALIPRKGDKANWLAGTDIVIDVLEPGSYTSVEIYKDGSLLKSEAISNVITLSGLEYGSYKARLTDGIDSSEWCSWIVVDAVSTATPAGADGKVNVTFSASNATPMWIQWAHGTNSGTQHVDILSEEEASNGSATVEYKKGSFKVRAAFQTEYGIIHSEHPDTIEVI